MGNYTPCPGCADEKWADVPGYEGFYRISTCGRIKSLRRELPTRNGQRHIAPETNLKQHLNVNGYPSVTLYRDRRGIRKQIHQLVLTTFVGECPAGMETLHADSVRTNPHLTNLSWGTSSDNNYDIVKAGNHWAVSKSHCLNGHELVNPNLVKSTAKRGHRDCLACARARTKISHARNRKGLDISGDMQKISDSYYEQIMSVA
ncbi:NUMOD4 domain-containing protein [Corynebacterium jeikeium]|uniref:NUMOD4 domain-containing protein n=1 Tax=Corynebacterium jeikeium TaxID=38289 RepID=UPI0001B714FB|nr:NUMOD4 domain-containing protein [Corynebacterium jeikeium]EEW17383.1 hypothetical protein HMPREF0297_0260 [Corynebacterium jeikeium ATCC 43734]OOD30757.1 hypothetical protein BWP03_06780 [Corynebacterium jeikeium]